jgi:hypothetical protein
MQFMMIVKASENSEAGVLPTPEQITTMQKYNEELVRAGVLLAAEGIHSTARGARVYFDGDKKTVVDGPFTETKELIAGFWIIQAKSLEEAVEWAKKAPNPHFGGKTNIEIRQVVTMEDFGEAVTPEVKEGLDRIHELAKAQRGS